MDPVTALGAAAAAGQFAEQAITLLFKLVELYKSSSQARATVEEYVSQLRRIKAVTEDIAADGTLIAPTLKMSLDDCIAVLKQVEDELAKLLEGFKKGRWRHISTSLVAVMKESDIEKLFARLDRCKLDLLLGLGYDSSKQARSLDAKLENLSMTPLRPAAPVNSMIWKVPNDHVQHFVGREAILKRLNDTLTTPGMSIPNTTGQQRLISRIVNNDTTVQRRCVLLGMGGQGKTQIALHFCRSCRKNLVDRLDAVLWVDASSEASLKASYKRLGDTLLPDAPSITDEHAVVDLVIDKIENLPKGWLMVYDNFDRPDEFVNLEEYIPDSVSGSILITSRHADSANIVADPAGQVIPVPGLEVDSAQQLLLQLSGKKSTLGDANLLNVVQLLACHPLAITQAATFIRKMKIAYGDFPEHYERSKYDILNNTPALTRYRKRRSEAEGEIAMSVFTTWVGVTRKQ